MSAVLVALVSTLALTAVAHGASPARPLDELIGAQRALGVLAGEARSPSTTRALLGAQAEVRRSTTAALWLDLGHLVAPSHGLSVFADCRAALRGLERIPGATLPSGALAAVEAQILAADRGLAENSILQALGGSGGLLARARGMILSGDRWAGTSRLDLAAEQYGAGWADAFDALTELVHLRLAFVSPRALASGAERAINAAPRLRPAGVHRLARPAGSGKPEVLFVGEESCAACAVERWAAVVALSRFGTFTALQLGQSAVTEQPFVRSFTFAGSRYVSPYVSFDPVELSSDLPAPRGGFEALGRLTARQARLLRNLDPRGIVPFIDADNRFVDVGAAVSPALIEGLSWSQLASSVGRPRTVPGRAIAASAQVLTAEICRATAGAPASVCGSAGVQDYSRRLARFGGRASGCPVGSGVTRRAVFATRRATLAIRR